jgi:CMP-N,N'-diacetyllegionaminic acid synthase
MIAIIPARKGSKGLKNKNFLKIHNKPLIAHTIIQAKKSKYIKKIIVSTDCKVIKKISEKYGAIVPFLRPKNLSQDNSDAIDVYRYMIRRLHNLGYCKFNSFIVLLPTSPLRRPIDIDNAIRIFKNKKADSVISVKKADIPISWYLKISKNQKLKKINNKNDIIKNRQKVNHDFIPNGSIYVFKTNKILYNRDYYFKNTYPYIMPKKRSVDIDDSDDFELAKFYFKRHR